MTTLQTTESTYSVSVLDVWEQGIGNDPICARALAMLLLSRSDLVHRINSLQAAEQCICQMLDQTDGNAPCTRTLVYLLALAQLQHMAGRPQEADACYRRAADAIALAGRDPEAWSALAEPLDQIVSELAHDGVAQAVRQRLQRQILMARKSASDLLAIREAAFDAFGAGEYAEAERIYRHLLTHHFERPGTHCHLARIYLATGRDAEANRAVEMAWDSRGDAPSYILARIHFLRALLAALAGQDSSPHLAHVTDLLNQPDCQHNWIMAPVLEALRPRLTGESHEMFARLAETLSGRGG